MKSIGVKLNVIILCAILLAISVAVSVSISMSGNAITNEMLDKAKLDTDITAYRLETWISLKEANLQTLTDSLSGMQDWSEETLRPVLAKMIENVETCFEVYIGYPDGTATTGSGYVFDYSWWHAPERGWYKQALTDVSRSHITSPYIDAQTGQMCISIVHAVMKEGVLHGVVGADIFVDEFVNVTLDAKMGDNGYVMLLDTNGDIIVHPEKKYMPDPNGETKNFATIANGAYAEIWKQLQATGDIVKAKDSYGVMQYFCMSKFDLTGWLVVTALPAHEVNSTFMHILLIVIPLSLVLVGLAMLLIHSTVRNTVTKPLIPLTSFMQKASATGSLELRPEDAAVIQSYSKNQDEMGICIGACALFIQRVTEIAKELGTMAEGDFTTQVTPLSREDMLGNSMQKMLDNMNRMFGEINVSASQVAIGSKQIADGAQALAQGTTEQASAIEQLSSSISEVANKTSQNAVVAKQTAELSNMIHNRAKTGAAQMENMMQAVKDINDASSQISKVIKVIDDIAFQTNILALNAAVEAARAGQHGKGFAVVAEEVSNLAAKSAEAAKETGGLIENSVGKANLGLEIATETSESLKEIVDGIIQSATVVTQIANSSEEQSQAIAQINTGIEQVSQVIQMNSATSQESAAAADEMSSQAELLTHAISQFKLLNMERYPKLAAGKKQPPRLPASA